MKTSPSDRAVASRSAATFRSMAEYLIRIRLRRQYQDYVMGMGWPQQLDLRVDGALVKRFTVGGEAKGRPAGNQLRG